jgi:DNA-binding response OmpR family regulator/DNA-binding CsgD family transcriptional regulator
MDKIIYHAHILVVDDNFETLSVLGKLLSQHDFIVSPASSGMQALALARSKKPDLILLDIGMPDIDGFEICTQLKSDAETAQIPIIFITGKTESEDLLKGFNAGAVDYIQKPFNQRELLARVKTHLGLVKLLQKNIENLSLLHQKEMELVQKEKEKAEAELLYKDRELLNITLLMTKFSKSNERFIYLFNQAIEEIPAEHQDKLHSVLKSYSLQLESDNWNQIESMFLKLHQDFFSNILNTFPSLTKNELRLCAFLRLNLSIKDIASITMQTEETIKKARYRLRQKLNMSTDESLNSLIMRF